MTEAEALRERLDSVQERLESHASGHAPGGLTDPDQPSGERWEWGQVWAHLGEFVPFWIGQVRAILGEPGPEAVPFGRVKTDTARIDAIEEDRRMPPAQLMARVRDHLDALRGLMGELRPEDWDRTGRHSTLGVMTMPQIFEEFLVGHLESHAAQLDGLAAGR